MYGSLALARDIRKCEDEVGMTVVRMSYRVVNHILIACIVVNVDGDAPESRDFGGKLREAGVILSGGTRGLG